MKVMIIPGNGNTKIESNWYLSVKEGLKKPGIDVIAKNMPDPDLASKNYWLPFMEKHLAGCNDSILIGHSSGAVAIMRYLETHAAWGAVLVGACHTDLGDAKEKASGYFDCEWKWNDIRNNCEWIIQFASTDDPYIPAQESRHIHRMLGTEYHEFSDRGHFSSPNEDCTEFPEIVEAVRKRINK